MEFSERVLVLQVGRFREADLWVRFLSPTLGVLSAFAFGGSRSKRRFVGCLDTFNEVFFQVKASTRNAYLALEEGTLIKGVSRLRYDWRRFGIAQNCAKFLLAFGVNQEGAGEAHFLFKELLQLLEEVDELPALLPLLFRVRLVFDQGYSVNLDSCSSCGQELHSGGQLLINQGQMLCPGCSGGRVPNRLSLTSEGLRVLTRVKADNPLSWTCLELGPSTVRECAKAIDGFIQYHVGLTWENGRFVRH